MTKDIAKTILQQLGGNKFIAMTGASKFQAHGGGPGERPALAFRIPTRKGINAVKVTLTPGDVYTVEFLKVTPPGFNGEGFRPASAVVKKKVEGVYFDQLQTVFTEATGLLTSLGFR